MYSLIGVIRPTGIFQECLAQCFLGMSRKVLSGVAGGTTLSPADGGDSATVRCGIRGAKRKAMCDAKEGAPESGEFLSQIPICNKDSGKLSARSVRSRGHVFIVGGGGHIEMFAKIFK